MGAINQLSKVLWNGAFNIMFVRLAEEKTSSRRRFQKFGGEQSSKPMITHVQYFYTRRRDSITRSIYFTIVDCPADV